MRQVKEYDGAYCKSCLGTTINSLVWCCLLAVMWWGSKNTCSGLILHPGNLLVGTRTWAISHWGTPAWWISHAFCSRLALKSHSGVFLQLQRGQTWQNAWHKLLTNNWVSPVWWVPRSGTVPCTGASLLRGPGRQRRESEPPNYLYMM